MKLTLPVVAMFLWTGLASAQTGTPENLQAKVEAQERQIEELQLRLARLERALLANETASIEPVARVVPVSTTAVGIAPREPTQPVKPAAGGTTTSPAAVQAVPQVAGFRLGGDFRFRFDSIVRDASSQAGGVQNIRQRYRLRLNVDRDIAPDLNFHMQMTTGAVNNGITFDQDFAGGVTRHPFFISEAFVDYHPNASVSLRGGKLEEVFADNSRFLWDDDIRFNGFNERWKAGRFELKAGQYFFVNPNTYSVSPTSPLATLAGVEPGTIARAATMFHQGMTIDNGISERWKGQFTADVQLYHNPNLIALTSNSNGVSSTLSGAVGLTLAGPAPGTGNATTAPGNAILNARHYQVVRAAYKIDGSALGGNAHLPVSWSVQVARNVGTTKLRDAIMSTISVGRTQDAGEIRALYTFAIKDANSMISQFTDDDLGTGVGTNIATHHFRLDYALRRGIVFQNLLFRQTERRSSNPAENLFVPLGRGTPATWRYQGQLAISF